MPKTENLAIDLLRIDGDTQSRIALNQDTVNEYADRIVDSDWPFPPLDVFHDGSEYFVGDGFHRLLAGRRVKRGSIPCRVHKGTARDARIFGMTANDKHGMRMTSADKRACIEWLLDGGEKMTQKAIARSAGVSLRTVKAVVAEQKVQLAPFPPQNEDKKATALHQDRPMSPSPPRNDGRMDSDDTEPQETATKPPKKGKGAAKTSAASIVDALREKLKQAARDLTEIAELNGGEGPQFKRADAGLNELFYGLEEMRKGKQ